MNVKFRTGSLFYTFSNSFEIVYFDRPQVFYSVPTAPLSRVNRNHFYIRSTLYRIFCFITLKDEHVIFVFI